MKARIYEIKSSAAANAEVLRDEENDRFFWNDLKFQDFEVGDKIFFVNKPGGWVLYTTIGEKDIATAQVNGKASFSYGGHEYSVDDPTGRFSKFVRFDVLQESPIGADDEWTSLGSSEVNDLWRDGEEVDTTTTRMERIQQLKRIFRDGEGAKALEEIEGMLGGAEPQVAQGVVVVDSGTWFEGAMADLEQAGHIVLWWSKRPVGVEGTLAELRNRLDTQGHFDLYYTVDRKARYRARVRDFATEADYSAARWSEGRVIAGLQQRFADYKGESPSGKMQTARIAFLVDRMERLEPEIPLLRFRFKNGPDGLTQDNMLPYTRVMKEPVWGVANKPDPIRSTTAMRFTDEHRAILCAIKTKPFILLAGISGTGKSRMVHTLDLLSYGAAWRPPRQLRADHGEAELARSHGTDRLCIEDRWQAEVCGHRILTFPCESMAVPSGALLSLPR
ncbi:MAG TPA: hypothetical protein PL070_18100 [Flavobacteriales bacterium]|nr:hypothetical protein [Flavobacteriales bacterium]